MDGGMSAWLPSFLAPVCVSSRRDEGEGEEAGEVTDALAAWWWGAAAAPDATDPVDEKVLRSRECRALSRAVGTGQAVALEPRVLEAIRKSSPHPHERHLRWMPFWEICRAFGMTHVGAKQLYALFDLNGDGAITEVEVRAAMRALELSRSWARYCPTCSFENECAYCDACAGCTNGCTSSVWCPQHWLTHPGRGEVGRETGDAIMRSRPP